MNVPVFVVVGHVNRGKSSIVSTLAADDSVRIDPMPGTTRRCREYPLVVSGKTLYVLVDTPGFERPRQMLAWLRSHETTTAERRGVVEAFVAEHRTQKTFREECSLLEPILRGGAILYVVDGSQPPSAKEEAEMEILRWTHQSRIALINPIGQSDYTEKWRPLLDQYFNLVRTFNAQGADFTDRLRLLRGLREMNEANHEAIDRAIEVLDADRAARLEEAAGAIAEMIVAMLLLIKQKRLAVDADVEPYKMPLAKRYYDRLRSLEAEGRRQIQNIFGHPRLLVTQEGLRGVDEDLFNIERWNHLGVTKGQLITAGAATGAAAGGVLDIAVGGSSFLAGLIVGGAAGGILSWVAANKLPQVKVKGIPLGGNLLQIGPMSNPGYPWVVLDRSLLFLELVTSRPHACREKVELTDAPVAEKDAEGMVAHLPAADRKKINEAFSVLQQQSKTVAVDGATIQLAAALTALLHARYA